jgi:hypothetical protein
MSRIVNDAGKIIDTAQDINSLIRLGELMAIAGTGFLVAKNPRVGFRFASKLVYLTVKARVNLGMEIFKLARSTYFESKTPKPKPKVVKGRPIASRPFKPRPPTGGINPVFTWGGTVLAVLVWADDYYFSDDEYDPITGGMPVA